MDAKPLFAMSHRALITGLAAVVAVSLGCRIAMAQDDEDGVAEARAIFDRALKQYRSLNTYQDQTRLEFALTARDGDGRDASRTDRSTGSLAYGGPGRFVIADDSTQLKIYRNDSRMWLVFQGAYTESKVQKTVDLAAAVPYFLRGSSPFHPVAVALSNSGAGFTELFPAVKSVAGAAAEVHQDTAGKRVSGTLMVGNPALAQTVPFSAWFADADGLLREIVIDLTETMQHAMASRPPAPGQPAHVERCHFKMRFEKIVTDADLPTGHFTFKPDKGEVRVESITPEALQRALIGHPAPPFKIEGPDGKPFALEKLRGRVVVIDFWATWCGPCIRSLPRMQQISERYAKEPVSFVCVNSDSPDAVDDAKVFLKHKNITIPQAWDQDNSISAAYRIEGIPCTVLLDTKGVVQEIHLGFSERLLTSDLDTLIKGGSLRGG